MNTSFIEIGNRQKITAEFTESAEKDTRICPGACGRAIQPRNPLFSVFTVVCRFFFILYFDLNRNRDFSAQSTLKAFAVMNIFRRYVNFLLYSPVYARIQQVWSRTVTIRRRGPCRRK
jgi:hypothetical protein